MLPAHHLLSQIPLRADAVVRRLPGEIWRDPLALEVTAAASGPEVLPFEIARKLPLKPVRARSRWGKLFDQRWFRIRLPKNTDGRTWLHWKDQGEATLYIDGAPYFGFDVAH